jgi:hypothetical protein
MTAPYKKNSVLVITLHLLTLWGFAVAQPLFNLLGRNPTFLVAHDAGPREILGFTLLLSLALPALIILLTWLTGVFSGRAREGLYHCQVFLLIVLVVLPLLKRIPGIPDTVLLGAATVVSGIGVLGYIRLRGLRDVLTLCSPAVLVFPLLFLLCSPVSNLIIAPEAWEQQDIQIANPVPIVMVIFDEISSTYLLDENNQVDAIRYPNFATLAASAWWFPNTTTVADATHVAVPAILTGSYYRHEEGRKRIPALVDYPLNLFTLYQSIYRLNIHEPITRLAPGGNEEEAASWYGKNASLFRDTAIVYAHIVSSEGLAQRLPDVTKNWGNFLEDNPSVPAGDVESFLKEVGEARKDDKRMGFRMEPFRKFTASLGDTGGPSLNFIHMVFPHTPYEYLPSGQRYQRVALTGLENGHWGSEWAAKMGFQRYLLQLSYTDRLLGELFQKLKAEGLYDPSLIIITADHGVSFKPGSDHRSISEENIGGLMPVPLFIKLPHQSGGVVDTRRVETIDIVPTIAEVTGTTLPWETDGYSLISTDAPQRTEARINDNWPSRDLSIRHSELDSARMESLERMLSWFGSGVSRPEGLWESGPRRDLLGESIGGKLLPQPYPFHVKLEREAFFRDVDITSGDYPALLWGKVLTEGQAELTNEVAIAVNGYVRATAWVSPGGQFAAMLPETAVQQGFNKIEVFLLSEKENGDIQLLQSRQRYNAYRLADGHLVHLASGEKIPVQPRALEGHMVEFQVREFDATASTWGWAADVQGGKPADEIIVFLDEKNVYAGKPTEDRPGVSERFQNDQLTRSGFIVTLPQSLFEKANTVRFFAISNGVASELKYGDGTQAGQRP